MGLFDGISFRWDGRTVAIPPDRLLGALARLEEVLPLRELAAMGDRARHGKVSEAFAAVLCFAGADVEAETVFARTLLDGEARAQAHAAITALIQSAQPPPRRRDGHGEAPQENPPGLVESLYRAIVGNGWATAGAFWAMTPREAWWLVEARTPPKMVGHLTEDDAEDLYQKMKEHRAELDRESGRTRAEKGSAA